MLKKGVRRLGAQKSFDLEFLDGKVIHFDIVDTRLHEYFKPPLHDTLKRRSLEFIIDLNETIGKLDLTHMQVSLSQAIVKRFKDMPSGPELRDVLNQYLLVSRGQHHNRLVNFYKAYSRFLICDQPRAFRSLYQSDKAFIQEVGGVGNGGFRADIKLAVQKSQDRSSYWGFDRFENPLFDKHCSWHEHMSHDSAEECSDNDDY